MKTDRELTKDVRGIMPCKTVLLFDISATHRLQDSCKKHKAVFMLPQRKESYLWRSFILYKRIPFQANKVLPSHCRFCAIAQDRQFFYPCAAASFSMPQSTSDFEIELSPISEYKEDCHMAGKKTYHVPIILTICLL